MNLPNDPTDETCVDGFPNEEELRLIVAELPDDHPEHQMAKSLLVLMQQEQYEAHIDARLSQCKTPEEQDQVLADALAAVSEFFTD